jgi:hypothetical protein
MNIDCKRCPDSYNILHVCSAKMIDKITHDSEKARIQYEITKSEMRRTQAQNNPRNNPQNESLTLQDQIRDLQDRKNLLITY